MTKYNSRKVIVDNHQFDSRDESLYFLLLKQQLADGAFVSFSLQPKYELIPKFTKDGINYRAICYSPDFEIVHHDGSIECVDVKGMATQQGDMRRKMFNFRYPNIKLTWVSRSIKYGENGWIEYDLLKRKRKEK